MATAPNAPTGTVSEPSDHEIPEGRTYEDDDIAELDQALEDALAAAEDADHEYLTHLLECELASLYYEQQLGV